MKLTTTAAIMATMAMTAMGAAAVKESGERVTVYLSDNASVDPVAKALARGMAAKMFAGIGVQIAWRMGNPPAGHNGAIGIELVTNTPQGRMPGALAYALPYEGVHIQIFWDRIQGASPSDLLAHVMVHEITHILEGTDRHSEEGVMKARWSGSDFAVMRMKPLAFAAADVELIRAGLRTRSSQTIALSSHPDMTPAQASGN